VAGEVLAQVDGEAVVEGAAVGVVRGHVAKGNRNAAPGGGWSQMPPFAPVPALAGHDGAQRKTARKHAGEGRFSPDGRKKLTKAAGT